MGPEATSPLTYEPKVPLENRFMIARLTDRLSPPEQARKLWEHWDRCKFHWYPGNHLIHVHRIRYVQDMGRFMDEIGFAHD